MQSAVSSGGTKEEFVIAGPGDHLKGASEPDLLSDPLFRVTAAAAAEWGAALASRPCAAPEAKLLTKPRPLVMADWGVGRFADSSRRTCVSYHSVYAKCSQAEPNKVSSNSIANCRRNEAGEWGGQKGVGQNSSGSLHIFGHNFDVSVSKSREVYLSLLTVMKCKAN